MKSLLLIPIALLLSGCASTGTARIEAQLAAHLATLEQHRTYDAVRLKGRGMQITLTNVDEIALQSPLAPLPGIPQAPTLMQSLGAAAQSIAPWAALGAGLYYNQPRAPTVVQQPPPVVVQPVFAP